MAGLYKPAARSKMAIAGVLLLLAGLIAFMGIITAEVYYPAAYYTATSEISDLGATRPPNSLIYQPSAGIFNTTMIITGSLILAAVFFLTKQKTRRLLLVPLTLFGVGIFGVGLFPGNMSPHPYFALLTFVSGGVSAVVSYKVIDGPYRYISVVLGVVSLIALFFSGFFITYIGDGGTERWVAYPITFWVLSYGSYLLGLAAGRAKQ